MLNEQHSFFYNIKASVDFLSNSTLKDGYDLELMEHNKECAKEAEECAKEAAIEKVKKLKEEKKKVTEEKRKARKAA